MTFYSQQVRALNLIDALCKTGALYEDSRVAVIGAGVAGVTAAVAAARRGLAVTLVEKHRDRDGRTSVLPRQWLSDERAVHPHVYDWPAPAATEPDAGLPLMDWAAGTAANVVKSLSDQFDKEREKEQIELLQANFAEHMIKPGERQWLAIDLPVHGKREVDALILALGFGEEEGQSYWDNDGLQSKKGEWLVSGTGDGGLTDVMRLCIDNFRHAEVVEKFGKWGGEAAEQLRAADDLESDKRPALFREVAQKLRERLKKDNTTLGLRTVSVWLAGTEEALFSPGASILNRLIAAYLLEQNAFKLIPYSTLKVDPLPTGRTKVTYTNDRIKRTPVDNPGYETEFDGVVLRHGPKSALQACCPKLYEACVDLEREWRAMQVTQDPTRTPIWSAADFDPASMPALDVDSRKGPFTVVVDGTAETGQPLHRLVNQALLRADKRAKPRSAVRINPESELASVHGYRRVLRALCRSEMAIFEITDLKPATMLLLGIRSVVKRGITLLTVRIHNTSDIPEPFDLPDRPFNIREASVIARRQIDNNFTEALKTAIIEGRNQLKLLAREYQDLPAYDAVRKLGGEPDNYRPIPPDTSVLVLSSYAKEYLNGAGQVVSTALGTSSSDIWQRIVESPSPQLASQKLYAAIRRTQMCVCDWTGWRPNLFFELGVRLAVNPQLPASIFCVRDFSELTDSPVLRNLFAPEFYETPDDVVGILDRLRAAIDSDSQVLLPGARLDPSFTFDEVQRWMDQSGETPIAVEEALDKEAAILVGPDRMKYPGSPLLYWGNESLLRKAEAAALDRWLAAWYFVDKRHSVLKQIEDSEHLPDDPLVQDWINRAFSIQSMLESFPDNTYDGIRQEVQDVINLCISKGV